MPDARLLPRPAIVEGDIAKIPLGVQAKHGYAIVDADMAWLADKNKWTLDASKRYVITGTYEHGGKRLALAYLHRVVMGHPSTGMVDHISRDRLDNRRCNLRVASNSANQANRPSGGGSSKYKGVSLIKRVRHPDVWRARIRVNGRWYYLGYYPTERGAALAYNKAAVKHFGEFALLNKA